jgi:hypothetical protein
MGEQMESLSPQVIFEDFDMVAKDGAVGPVSRILGIPAGCGKLDVADADVFLERIQQIVHHVVGQGGMVWEHQDRQSAVPGPHRLDPQPSNPGPGTAQGVRHQSLVAGRILLREELSQAQRKRFVAAAAAYPYGLPLGQMSRYPHAPIESAGRALKSHRPTLMNC